MSDANDEDAHVDSAERAVAGNDDRRWWVKLHDVLFPRFDVTDEDAVEQV